MQPAGVEPVWVAPLEPESSASTNSAISADLIIVAHNTPNVNHFVALDKTFDQYFQTDGNQDQAAEDAGATGEAGADAFAKPHAYQTDAKGHDTDDGRLG